MTLAQFFATHRMPNAIVVPGRAQPGRLEQLFRIPGLPGTGQPFLGIVIDADGNKKK